MSAFRRTLPAFLCAVGVLCGSSALGAQAARPALTITDAARSLQPGEVVVLTIGTGTRADAVHVRAFNRDMPALRVDALHWRALVGIDLDVRPGRHPIAVEAVAAAKTLRATHVLVVRPRRFPTRRLKVDETFVNPPPGVAGRIARRGPGTGGAVAALPAASRGGPTGFVRPVSDPANSRFGARSIYNGQPRSQHGGADFLSPAGTPVQAPNAAQVVLARDLYFLGHTVVLDHGQGLFSILAHLSEDRRATGRERRGRTDCRPRRRHGTRHRSAPALGGAARGRAGRSAVAGGADPSAALKSL